MLLNDNLYISKKNDKWKAAADIKTPGGSDYTGAIVEYI